MKRIKREIDLSTEEKKKEFFAILNGFKCKREAYEYLGISGNNYGINRLNELSSLVGFDLNSYADKRKVKPKYCLKCGKEFMPKSTKQKFCSSSCAASYNNEKREKPSEQFRLKISEGLKKYYSEHPKKILVGTDTKVLMAKKLG